MNRLYTDGGTEATLVPGDGDPERRQRQIAHIREQMPDSWAIDILLDGLHDAGWLVCDTPDGTVIAIRDPRARELSALVLAELQSVELGGLVADWERKARAAVRRARRTGRGLGAQGQGRRRLQDRREDGPGYRRCQAGHLGIPDPIVGPACAAR
jgi:hypothetical protein